MAAAVASFRYSTGEVASSEAAKAFAWEQAVPVHPFWDSFDYPTARSFLSNISDSELAELPINSASAADHRTKLQLLLTLLREKLSRDEAAASPQSLHDADYKQWYNRVQGLYVLENELDLPEAEQTIQTLVAGAEKSDVRPQHLLGEYLVKTGKYAEAEGAARPVAVWMLAQPHLGKYSPQYLSAQRLLVRALWGQGASKRTEAEALLAGIQETVEGLSKDGGKFGVYQGEEQKLNEELLAQLEK
ncbi:hypothetical protein B0T22DRAFT_460247 [Podospora appendiculata]|uniref:Uncharacterized protein n=1 Tax=Podospora appendiculata TaxID=314037 RepID=A0AAE0XAE9_9PEZI|nr:hypothetical protein B0T22DRAFT_460247 [Podospora appendiculata]